MSVGIEYAYGFMDAFAFFCFAVGVVFLTAGNRYHDYLTFGVAGAMGTFVGLLVTNHALAVLDGSTRVILSLVLGAAVCFAATRIEGVAMHATGMGMGVGAATVVYNVIANVYVDIASHYLVLALTIGAVGGTVGAPHVMKHGRTAVYVSIGGFLVSSSLSFALWRTEYSTRGDVWIMHVTSSRGALDLGAKSNMVCLAVWIASAVVGVFVQNSCCAPEKEKPRAVDERTPFINANTYQSNVESGGSPFSHKTV